MQLDPLRKCRFRYRQ